MSAQQAQAFALAATSSAANAKNSTGDHVLRELAEAIEYLGYALAELAKGR